MPATDVLIIGGGVIGLSLACELRRRGLTVELHERGRCGNEASGAAAGMLAATQMAPDSPYATLAVASARLYPAFVRQLQTETGLAIDYGQCGTVLLGANAHAHPRGPALSGEELRRLAPGVRFEGPAYYFPDDHYVDNRQLMSALRAAALQLGVRLSEDSPVTEVGRTAEGAWVRVADGSCRSAAAVVNAAGSWASQMRLPVDLPVIPRKGQALEMRLPAGETLPRVLVGDRVYMSPRRNGNVVIGATLEDAGFDKSVQPDVIEQLRLRATALLPLLQQAELVGSWAGLRPATPDELPYLGQWEDSSYWLATGHFRDGILMAPVTAVVLADALEKKSPQLPLAAFAPGRELGVRAGNQC